MDRLGGPLACRACVGQEVDAVAPVERDPSIVATERSAADPDHLAGGAELVEQARGVAGDACRQDVALEHRGRDRHPLELGDDLDQPPGATGRRADPVPRGEEAREHGRVDRLDLAPQARQRAPAQLAQDVRIGELVRCAARAEGALQQAAGLGQPAQVRLDRLTADAPARGRIVGREGGMRACPTQQQPVERSIGRLEVRLGHPGWRRCPDGVAVAGGVLDRDPSLLAPDPQPDRPASRGELLERVGRIRAAGASGDLVEAQVAEASEQVGDAIDRSCAAGRRQQLQLELQVGDRFGIDQLAELLAAQQLGQELSVERQRLCPSVRRAARRPRT